MSGLIKVTLTSPVPPYGQMIPGDGAAYPIVWTSVVADTSASMLGWWDAADPGYLKVPASFVPQHAMIGFRLAMAPANPVGGPRRFAGVYKNDVSEDVCAHHHHRTTTKGADIMGDTTGVRLNPGDRFQLLALQDSGVPLNVIGDNPARLVGQNTHFWVLVP